MYCAACGVEVTLGDSRCSSCNADLMEMNAIAYERPLQKGGEQYRQSAKKMVMDETAKEAGIVAAGLDANERRILVPFFEQRLKPFFARFGSDEEFDLVFSEKIVPSIKELAGDPSIQSYIDGTIQSELKVPLSLYRNPSLNAAYEVWEGDKKVQKQVSGYDVIETLRAGQVVFMYLEGNQSIHSAGAIFPFCKAVEMACWLHSAQRYHLMSNDPQLQEIVGWIKRTGDDEHLEYSLPGWMPNDGYLSRIIKSITKEKVKDIAGASRVAAVLYVFGMESALQIRNINNNETVKFEINNLFRAQGMDEERIDLSYDLTQVQGIRNGLAHLGGTTDLGTARVHRAKACSCLVRLPQILPFISA